MKVRELKKILKDIQKEADAMKDKMYDQRTVAFSKNYYKEELNV